MADIVKIGVVGAGSIAVRGIMPHLSQEDVQDRVRIWAICDPVEGRAEAAVGKFGGKHAFRDFDELLEKGEVDAVTIASPIGLHYEQGKKALAAGKHIHFNKTMTTTVDEATELIETAKAKGLKIVASPGQVLRPHLQHTKKVIAEGGIGTLAWAACGAAFGGFREGEFRSAHITEYVRQGNDVLSNINPSWYYRKPGGGPLYDMTVYSLHELTSVLGPAKRVTAMSGVRISEREFRGEKVPCDADDNTLITVDFGKSLFAFVFGVASGTPYRSFEVSFYGTNGTIAGTTMNGEPMKYPGSDEVEAARAAGLRFQLLPHVVGPHRDIQESHVFEDIMQLVDWVREDKPTPVTAEQARHVVDIIESGYRAAETGQTQTLRTTF